MLDMGVDSIALVRLQNTLNLSLNLEISPSVLFENPAPRVMAERLRLSFEAQNPVVVGALKFNAKDKLQTIKGDSDQKRDIFKCAFYTSKVDGLDSFILAGISVLYGHGK